MTRITRLLEWSKEKEERKERERKKKDQNNDKGISRIVMYNTITTHKTTPTPHGTHATTTTINANQITDQR